MILLFPAGLPGGTELMVILLVALFGFVPLAALLVGVYVFGKSRGKSEAYEQSEQSERDRR